MYWLYLENIVKSVFGLEAKDETETKNYLIAIPLCTSSSCSHTHTHSHIVPLCLETMYSSELDTDTTNGQMKYTHTWIAISLWTNAYWINTYLRQGNLQITPFIIYKIPVSKYARARYKYKHTLHHTAIVQWWIVTWFYPQVCILYVCICYTWTL